MLIRRLICAFLLASALLFGDKLQAQNPQDLLNRARALKEGGVLMDATTYYEDFLRRAPENVDARIELIEVYLKLRRLDKAEPHIAIARREKPNDPRVQQFSQTADAYYESSKSRRLEEFERKARQPDVTPETLLEFARFLAANKMTARSFEIYNRYLAQRPNDKAVRFEVARRYSWERRYGVAIDMLLALIADAPDHTDARLLLGNIFFWQGREDEAVVEYQRLLQIEPNNVEAKRQLDKITSSYSYRERKLREAVKREGNGPTLVLLASLYVEQGRIFEADSLVELRLANAPNDKDAKNLSEKIKQLKQVEFQKKLEEYSLRLKRNPNDSAALIEMARHYTAVPDFDKAIDTYNKYLKLHPLDYRTRLRRAEVLSWSGRNDEAIQEFRIIAVVMPDDRETQLGLGDALLASGAGLKEAEDIFERDLNKFPGNLRALIGYAEALRRQGNYSEAEKAYHIVLRKDPANEVAREGLRLLNKDLNPLIEKLIKHLEAYPKDYESRRRLAGLLYDAQRYYEAGDQVKILLKSFPDDTGLKAFLREIDQRQAKEMSQELINLKELVQREPVNFDARLLYARRLAAEGRRSEAVAQYRSLAEISPHSDSLKVEYAEVLIANKQLKEAEEIYKLLADENPSRWEYRYRHAEILSWMGDNATALDEYEMAKRLNPQSIELRIAIANAYRWSGDTYGAFDAYNGILELDPQNKTARKALDDMNGAFFRGVQISTRSIRDNEDFQLRETRGLGIASVTLKARVRAGAGSISFEQPDSAKRFDFKEKGRFWFAGGVYHFDKLTQAEGEIRFHQYANRKSTCYNGIINHKFDDVPDLVGLTGRIGYTSQDAVLDLASTGGLAAWHNNLRSDIFIIGADYVPSERWELAGQFNYISVTDGNSRADGWGNIMHALRDYLDLGVRYDRVSSREVSPDYWSPKLYETVVVQVGIHNEFTKWRYDVLGSVGTVLKENFAVRQITATVDYRVGTRLDLGLTVVTLRTVRSDGEYKYSGLSGFITWNR